MTNCSTGVVVWSAVLLGACGSHAQPSPTPDVSASAATAQGMSPDSVLAHYLDLNVATRTPSSG